MTNSTLNRYTSIAYLFVLSLLMISQTADADVLGQLRQGGNQSQAENKIGEIISWVIAFIFAVGVGLGLLKSAWGLVSLSGWIGDENQGGKDIKSGLMVAGGCSLGVILVGAIAALLS